jgi:hypothetical protein
MRCANCGKEFRPYERRTWAVLPGGEILVPVCREDRSCQRRRWSHSGGQTSNRMQKVREIARRYVLKGVS